MLLYGAGTAVRKIWCLVIPLRSTLSAIQRWWWHGVLRKNPREGVSKFSDWFGGRFFSSRAPYL